MRKIFLILAVALSAVAGSAAEPAKTPSPYESAAPPTAASELDKIVFAKLSSLGIEPVALLRRGVRATGLSRRDRHAAHRRGSPGSSSTTRTRRTSESPLIDRLLERDEFADYWSMKWGDVLRIKAEFPVNLWPNAAQAYHRWVRASIAENKPYDRFVREMLTSSGSNFRVGPVNFYRAIQNRTPEGIATAAALTFMGSRADSWPKDRLAGMAVFFSQIGYKPTSEWKEEHVFWDPLRSSALAGSIAPGQAAIAMSAPAAGDVPQPPPADAAPLSAVFPDGTKVELAAGPRSAGSVRRLAHHARRTPGSRGASPTASGRGSWVAGSFTSRTTSATTTRRAIPNCWPASRRS